MSPVCGICGNIDGQVVGGQAVSVGDLTYLISYLWKGGSAPEPLWVANVDGLGGVDVADVTYLVDYLFKGGPEPNCVPIEGTEKSTSGWILEDIENYIDEAQSGEVGGKSLNRI